MSVEPVRTLLTNTPDLQSTGSLSSISWRMGIFETTKFDVSLTIEKISKIPHSSGRIFVRWYVKDSPRPESRGRTPAVDVSHNKAVFDYHATPFPLRIGVKTGSQVLRTQHMQFEVLWEPPGTKAMCLGTLALNLAEFATPMRQREEPNNKTYYNGKFMSYLLEEAKINCLLTVGIRMSYLKGSSSFTVPQFSAPAVHQNLNDVDDPVMHGHTNGHGNDDKYHSQRENSRNIANIMDGYIKLSTSLFNQVDPDASLEDLIEGGDGFMGHYPTTRKHDTEHVQGQPFKESEIRENFRTWSLNSDTPL